MVQGVCRLHICVTGAITGVKKSRAENVLKRSVHWAEGQLGLHRKFAGSLDFALNILIMSQFDLILA